MGDWFQTCGLSQLPIEDGDPVVLFPLARNAHAKTGGSAFTESYSQYSVVSLPLYGHHESEYGRITLQEKNAPFTMRHFHSMAERMLLRKTKETDVPQSIDELANTFLRRPLYEGMGYTLFHKPVYEAVLNEINTRTRYNEKVPMRTQTFEKEARAFFTLNDELQEQKESVVAALKEVRKQSQETPDDKNLIEKRVHAFRNHQLSEYEYSSECLMENRFYRYFTADYFPNHGMRINMLRELMKSEPQVREKLLKETLDVIMIEEAMDLLRKSWTPQAGGGSSSMENHLHAVIANAVMDRYNANTPFKEFLR